MTPREFIDFLHLAERLKDNTRHSTTSQGRPESVAEHSWRVALMAMLLSGEAEGVDLNKVLRMCVIHDLGEAITGDIPSFWKTEADTAKEDKEVFALAESLPEPVRSEWKELFAEMIEMKTPEARVYKALDKLEAVLQHNEAPLSTWIPLEYELNQTYGMEEAKASIPFLEAVRNLAVTDTKEKLQNQNNQSGKREGVIRNGSFTNETFQFADRCPGILSGDPHGDAAFDAAYFHPGGSAAYIGAGCPLYSGIRFLCNRAGGGGYRHPLDSVWTIGYSGTDTDRGTWFHDHLSGLFAAHAKAYRSAPPGSDGGKHQLHAAWRHCAAHKKNFVWYPALGRAGGIVPCHSICAAVWLETGGILQCVPLHIRFLQRGF